MCVCVCVCASLCVLNNDNDNHLLLKEYFGSRDWQICPLLLEFPLLPDPLLVDFFNKEI